MRYRKIPKISPQALYFSKALFEGLIFGRAYILGGAYLRMEICVSKQIGFSLMVGRNFTIFAFFYFVFEGNFQVHQPPGSLYLEGRFNGGFFAVRVLRGLTFGVAYTWRDLFSKFYGIFGTTVMSSRTYITQVLCDNNLITRAFKSDYGCAKIAVQL